MIFGFFGRLIFGDSKTSETQAPVEPPKKGGGGGIPLRGREYKAPDRPTLKEIQRDDEEVMAIVLTAMELIQ